MLRCCLLIAFAHLAVAQVNFPEDTPAHNQLDAEPEARFGMKYLGYFLSLLGSSFVGYQGVPIQTPVRNATTLPATQLPLFSTFPSNVPVVSDATTVIVPPPAATAETDMSITVDASPFPTALPTYFPGGLISSFGTFPTMVGVETSVAPLVTTNGYVCGCLPSSICVNSTTRAGISVRIVTTPPTGITCPPGMVYCCAPNMGHLCGLQNVMPGVTPGVGQANLGEFPWSAIILTDADVYVGGGALIDTLHVLTAAHKVASYGNGANLKIRFGDWDLSNTREPVRYVEVKVKSITNHPGFDATQLKNDMSIITLASPVAVLTAPSPQINTICLPSGTDTFTGSRCWVAGWGKDQFNGAFQQIIKKVDLPVVAAGDCQTRLRQTRLGNSFVLDNSTFLCAGGEASKDACTGDGGNALACERNGQYYIAGITVGGVECGLANVPGLYANVVNYIPWINSVIRPSNGIDPRTKPAS